MLGSQGGRRRSGRSLVSAEPLESRLCLSAAVVGSVTGSLQYEYPTSATAGTAVPLVGRTVYADAAGTGSYVAGDPVAATDLQGHFTLGLTGSAEAVRVLPRPGWVAAADGSDGAVASPGDVLAPFEIAMADPAVIDVVAAYTSSATRAYGPSAPAIGDTVAGLFAYANQVQGDSDTNVRMNLIETVPTAYAESGTFTADLKALSAGGIADVAAASAASAADLAVLIEGDANRGTGGEIGLGYEFARGRPNRSQGVAVVSLLGNANRDGVTLAHEFGHLLGADHDPAHATGGAAPYAHGYPFTGTDGVAYQDVMSYGAGTFLPFYSTPAAFFAGHVMGRVANGNNARAVATNGPTVARYATSGDEGPAAPAGPTTLVQSAAVRVPKKGLAGGTRGGVTVRWTNAGVAAVAVTATVTLTMTAATAGSADVPLATVAVPVRLRAGASVGRSVPVVWPIDLPAGTYQLRVTSAVAGGFGTSADGTGPTSAVTVLYRRSAAALWRRRASS